jgi:hypothetical protein
MLLKVLKILKIINQFLNKRIFNSNEKLTKYLEKNNNEIKWKKFLKNQN